MNRRKFIAVTTATAASMLACAFSRAEGEKPDAKKDCPKKEGNIKKCTCTNTGCPRRGICCECVFYHRGKGEKPFCLR